MSWPRPEAIIDFSIVLHSSNIAVTETRVYWSQTQPGNVAIFCFLGSSVIPCPLPELATAFKSALGTTDLDCRLYDALASVASRDVPPDLPHVMVTVAMTPPPGDDEKEFNDWYTEEHIPLLSCVPHWMSSGRFLLLSSTDRTPRYFALHTWSDIKAFNTPEYKVATSTPRREEVVQKVVERERFAYSYTGDLEKLCATSK